MYLIDAHCHLNSEYFPDGLGRTFQNGLNNDVRMMIFASSDVKSSVEAAELAARQTSEPSVFALAGVHPHEAEKVSTDYLSDIKNILAKDRVVAIGEIGLDYFYDYSPRDIQRRVFREQIELAKELGKPIIMHIRDAADRKNGDANAETIDILRETGAGKVGGVVHCFSRDMQNMMDAVELGFYISFAGPLTFPRNEELRKIASVVPLDKLMCETDSPYLAPQGSRGKPNEPAHVRQVYELLAMLHEVSLEKLSEQVRLNVHNAFRLGEVNV